MQFLEVTSNLKLNDLRSIVGPSNVEEVLVTNSLQRSPNLGSQIIARNEQALSSGRSVTTDYKINTLSRFSTDADVFENTALLGDSGWRVLQTFDALPNTLKIPESITLPLSADVIGNSVRVADNVFKAVMQGIKRPPHTVDPEIFNTYSNKKSAKIRQTTPTSDSPLFQFFKIPWGDMTIYSSISKDSKDFPVYPEEMSDGVRANYTTMPELLYQYEPWQIYTSSGPRSNTYNFTFHRDMWTGDHRDGKANELVRFCMSNCYPEYNGSAVNAPIVVLYMNGAPLIRGILSDVAVTWDGPLGLDNFYLVCKLALTITEVSDMVLDYWSVMKKPLIG